MSDWKLCWSLSHSSEVSLHLVHSLSLCCPLVVKSSNSRSIYKLSNPVSVPDEMVQILADLSEFTEGWISEVRLCGMFDLLQVLSGASFWFLSTSSFSCLESCSTIWILFYHLHQSIYFIPFETIVSLLDRVVTVGVILQSSEVSRGWTGRSQQD